MMQPTDIPGVSLKAEAEELLETRRIRFYATALRRHGLTVEFILEALSDPAWPQDSRDSVRLP